MKVHVVGSKVFVTGDSCNEEHEIELSENMEFFIIGCNITFKDSLFLRFLAWLGLREAGRLDTAIKINHPFKEKSSV